MIAKITLSVLVAANAEAVNNSSAQNEKACLIKMSLSILLILPYIHLSSFFSSVPLR
jgi:hypothetical protein